MVFYDTHQDAPKIQYTTTLNFVFYRLSCSLLFLVLNIPKLKRKNNLVNTIRRSNSITMSLYVLIFFLPLFLSPPHHPISASAVSLPLSTNSRWIVDETGRRVKLACVSWVSHLDAVVAEGLSKQPLDALSKKIGSMGFNCVRLTWPLYLVTNDSLANLTVRRSFQNLGLMDPISGIQTNNPSIIDMSLIDAFQVIHLH